MALDLLTARALQRREHEQEFLRWQVAAVRSDIWNVNRDLEKHPPLGAADFMPGAKSQAEKEEEEMREFAEKVMRGEKFEVDPAAAARFRAQMQEKFAGIEEAGKVTHQGPRGFEPVKRS